MLECFPSTLSSLNSLLPDVAFKDSVSTREISKSQISYNLRAQQVTVHLLHYGRGILVCAPCLPQIKSKVTYNPSFTTGKIVELPCFCCGLKDICMWHQCGSEDSLDCASMVVCLSSKLIRAETCSREYKMTACNKTSLLTCTEAG